MLTLFMDTHLDGIILAIYQDNKLLKIKEIIRSSHHSEACMPLLIELLQACDITVHDLNEIIVVNGPGSFTGERLGVTIAKTLAYTLQIPIYVISSLELYLQPDLNSYDFIAMKEKNGYYLGKLDADNKSIIDYKYVKNADYENIVSDNKVLLGEKIDYDFIISIAHQREPLNPHMVNPFYVKKIEVEK